MTKYYTIILSTVVLFSCKPDLSERKSEVIEVFKKDLELKMNQSNNLKYYFLSEMRYPNRRERMVPWYYMQYDLLKFYDGLRIDTINPWVDSLNKKIVKLNDVFKEKIKNGDKIYFTPLITKTSINDSFDLLLFKNKYLSKVIDIQMLIADQINSVCRPIMTSTNYYINDYNSMKELYKTNDTLNAYFLPSMYLDEKTISEIKLYKDNKLIYKTNTKTENFNYSPLKAGKYTLKYAVFLMPSFGVVSNNVLIERSYTFEVK